MRSNLQEILTPELKQENSYKKNFSANPFFLGVAVFLITLLTTIAFHLIAEGPKKTLCFDARQYIFDTGRIAEFILAMIKGQWRPELICDQQFLTSILADGPAFPSIFACFFAVLGHPPGIQDCRAIEVLQSMMHAISACLLFSLSYLLSDRWKTACFAGLAWGLYPAAIFWSGIFYTETTVILFTLFFLLALSQARRAGFALLAGILAGTVALLKPALLPAAFLSMLLLSRISKRSILIAICGTILALTPWMLYTRVLSGHACITAQRFPAFNLAMGADTEVDACLVSPAPPLTILFSRDNDMPLAFPLAQWQFHTGDCLRLAAVKLSCLWSRQANDFRLNFFGISPQTQNYWHLFLLFCGLAGLSYSLFNWRNAKLNLSQSNVVLASLIFLGSHLSYVLFTPAARYGMTAMPFFILFASLLPLYIVQIKNKHQTFILSTACLLSALIVSACLAGKNLSPVFTSTEKAYALARGDQAEKNIDLSKIKKPESIYATLLLVDADQSIENAVITVNGKSLPTNLRHVRYFDSTLYQQAFELRSLGYPSGIATDDFRHWRAVMVPSEFINWQGENKIELKQEKTAATIYGDPPSSRRRMLDLHYFSVNSLCNSDSSLDLRIPSPIPTGDVNTSSMIGKNSVLKPTGENEASKNTLQDSLRIRLAVVLGQPVQIPETKEMITEQEISPEQFDLYMQVPEIKGIRASRPSIKAARSTGVVCKIPMLNKASHVHVSVEGELRGPKAGKAEVVVALQPDRQGTAAVLNTSPQLIPYKNEWNHFCTEDFVPTSILDNQKSQSIYVAVYPGPWLDFSGYSPDKNCGIAEFRNLKFKITAAPAPDIAGKRVLFY